ncbi:SMI1/KNR4 family protein [Flagellimonas sp. 2504JD4-2]
MIDILNEKTQLLKQLIHKTTSERLKSLQFLPFEESEVVAFEEKCGIILPEQYREYLLKIGNGGFDVEPLRLSSEYQNLSLPWEDDATQESSSYGVLYISAEGCGVSNLLVISGERRGEIWMDLLEEGFRFVSANFFDWYNSWLDQNIDRLNGKVTRLGDTIRRISNVTNDTLPKDKITLHNDYLYAFKDIDDQKPLDAVLTKYLEVKDVDGSIYEEIIDHILTENTEPDYDLLLQFTNRALKESSVKDDTFYKDMLCYKGQMLVESKQFEEAVICFEQALEIGVDYSPQDMIGGFTHWLISAYWKTVQTKKALKYLLPREDFYDIDSCTEIIADIYVDFETPEATIFAGEALLEFDLFKEDEEYEYYVSDVHYYLYCSYAKLNDQTKANFYLNEMENNSEEPFPYEDIFRELFDHNLFSKALSYLEKYEDFLQQNRDDLLEDKQDWIYDQKGKCYEGMEDSELAIISFQKSFDNKKWVVPYANLIKAYKRSGNVEKAQELSEKLLVFDPNY